METRRCVARGRVQGVGFRWFVVRNARDLGVRGTVRNRPDGGLEAILQADEPEAVERLLERIREGPGAARVEALDVEAVDEPGREYDEMTVVR